MSDVVARSHWMAFAVVAVAVAYGLRALGWWTARAASQRLASAREALGLPRRANVRDAVEHATRLDEAGPRSPTDAG